MTGQRVLVFVHGWDHRFEDSVIASGWKSFWFKNTFVKSDEFLVLGQLFKEKLHQLGVPSHKPIRVISTIADDRFLPDLKMDQKFDSYQSQVKVLFLSRMVKEKGIYIALDAFNIARKALKGRDLSLIMAGSGDELEEAKRYVAENDIPNVEFLGFITGDQKGQVLNEAHIMLFPTYYGEGLPCTILEGMLYGMPIISRINAGIPDVVVHQVNGFLSDSKAPSIFADYLQQLIKDPELYHQIMHANHQKAKEHFTSTGVRDRLLRIYQEVARDQ
jgi:glycosyltransferase involved in cell wall biosynthesis